MDRLKQIREDLEKSNDLPVFTVREFLSWFGAQRRGFFIVQKIRKELSTHMLETEPDFESEYIDATITFKIAQSSVMNSIGATETKVSSSTSTSGSITAPYSEPTYRLSRLAATNREVISVAPDSDLTEAITKMITHDYSQLPVMQGTRSIKGYISWKTIGLRSTTSHSGKQVRHFMETNAPIVRKDQSLFKTIPMLIENDFVFVINEKQEISGVITSIDFALQFLQMSEPFLLIGEIENYIRKHLNVLTPEELQAAKDGTDSERAITNVSDLTFGEYVRLLQNPTIWEKLSLRADRKLVCDYLEEVRKIRNIVMHFDPDGIEAQDLEKLKQITRLFQTLNSI